MKRIFAATLTPALVVAALVAAPSSAVACVEGVAAETLAVSLKPAGTEYSVGDTAVIKARVQRRVGKRMFPAEGVTVQLGVTVRDTRAFGVGVSDSNGLATLEVRLKGVSPGVADAEVLARKAYAEDLPCHLGPREEGHAEVEDLFVVRRAR